MTDLQYFPSVNLFGGLFKQTVVEFNQYENYRKGGLSNRCLIAGSNGIIKLTVPIVGGRDQKSLLKDIVIVKDQAWQLRQFKTIKSCYNRSPWFEEYHDSLAELFNRRVNFLIDWNLDCMEWACLALGWKGQISFVQSPALQGKAILDEPEPSAIDSRVIRYRQVFEDRTGFIPNLSILDLLFCEGDRAQAILNE